MSDWEDIGPFDRMSRLARLAMGYAAYWSLETCGLLYPDGPITIRNVSERPKSEYAMDPGHQFLVMSKRGWPEAMWHTHPGGTRAPSSLDLRSAMPRVPMAIGARGGWFGVWLDQIQIMEVRMTQGTNDTVELFQDEAGEWRWRRKAANGQVISGSDEGYTRREDAARAARRVNPDAYADGPQPESAGASDALSGTAGGVTSASPATDAAGGGLGPGGGGGYTAPTPPATTGT